MKLVCIGSGNVATHMAQAFKSAGHEILQVWSRHIDHADVLAKKVSSSPIADLEAVDVYADLYLISVKDDAIFDIAAKLKNVKGLVVHTSGSTDISIVNVCLRYGVLYPLQTFSLAKALDFSQVPLCIEAGNAVELKLLKNVARELSANVYEVNSEQRRSLHLAAVFASNFSNHLYHLSHLILKDQGLDFGMLKPLIMETAEKVQQAMPLSVQTGPAVRQDEQTIQKHTAMLQGKPQLSEIYKILSDSIKKTHS